MSKVLVLLSTYNGERYLAEQLDSLYLQDEVNIHILVRDDGSMDKTIDILKSYQNNKGKMSIIEGQNVGAGPSFLALINEAATRYRDYDYYAFCDQDDVWFPHKIKTGVRALEKSSNDLKLYFSGSINTDSLLKKIGSCNTKVINTFGANLVSNHILGCTMLINKALIERINVINTKPYTIKDGRVPLHDGWAAFVAYSLNADVIYDATPLMYYRQHENNVVGAGKSFLLLQINRIKRYLGKSNHGKSNKCIIALQILEGIPDNNKSLIQLVATYKKNIRAKVHLLFDKRMYEYNLMDNLGTALMLLFNKF